VNVCAILRPIQDEIDKIEKREKSKMIKMRVLNELTAEVSAREAEAYVCTGGLEYGPGHCRHQEHMALRYARFRRNHPASYSKRAAIIMGRF
jgi:hypothetical protein